MSTIEQVVAKLNLTSPSIYVGRQRVYPIRTGINLQPAALEQLEIALANPGEVSSAIRIKDGDLDVFHCTARGEVKLSTLSVSSQIETGEEETKSTGEPLPQNEELGWQNPTSARADYIRLLGGQDGFESLKQTCMHNSEIGNALDQKVYMGALAEGWPPERMIYCLSQGPFIQSLAEKDVPISRMNEQYIAPMMTSYINKSTNTRVETEGRDEFGQLSEPSLRPSTNAFVNALDSQAKDTRDLASQHLSTFRDKASDPYWKQWATQQMPKLRNYIVQSAKEKGPRLKDWLKDQGPLLGAALFSAKATKNSSLKAWAASQGPTVKQTLDSLGQEALAGLQVAGREIGDLAWKTGGEVIEMGLHKVQDLATPGEIQDVTNDQIEEGGRALIDLYGRDGNFSGLTFDFHDSQDGLEIHLKDGTPAFIGGKIAPGLPTRYADRLRRIPVHVASFRANVSEIRTQTRQHRGSQSDSNNKSFIR
jgi:hypothetical protein